MNRRTQSRGWPYGDSLTLQRRWQTEVADASASLPLLRPAPDVGHGRAHELRYIPMRHRGLDDTSAYAAASHPWGRAWEVIAVWRSDTGGGERPHFWIKDHPELICRKHSREERVARSPLSIRGADRGYSHEQIVPRSGGSISHVNRARYEISVAEAAGVLACPRMGRTARTRWRDTKVERESGELDAELSSVTPRGAPPDRARCRVPRPECFGFTSEALRWLCDEPAIRLARSSGNGVDPPGSAVPRHWGCGICFFDWRVSQAPRSSLASWPSLVLSDC